MTTQSRRSDPVFGIYSCPQTQMWSYEESITPKKRICTTCQQLTTDVFARVIKTTGDRQTFCTKACWDKKHIAKAD